MTDPRINEIQARVDAALSYDLEAPIQFDDTESYAYNCGAAVLADDAAFLLARLAEAEQVIAAIAAEMSPEATLLHLGVEADDAKPVDAEFAARVQQYQFERTGRVRAMLAALSASPEPKEGK